MEEGDKEASGDGTDPVAPGTWLVLRVVRGRGWKETVGDTGPCCGVGMESTPTGRETETETNSKDCFVLRARRVPRPLVTLSLPLLVSQFRLMGKILSLSPRHRALVCPITKMKWPLPSFTPKSLTLAINYSFFLPPWTPASCPTSASSL